MTSFHSATQITAQVRAGESTAVSQVQAAKQRIATLDHRFNAITVVRDSATAEAAAVDKNLHEAAQPTHPLAGVPVVVKEEYDIAGDVTTLGGCGNLNPTAFTAPVITKLRDAGAVVVARTNMPEFGQFPAGESEYHGATLNPWNPNYSPGGSSAGSAVAVATGMVPVALGADGGGSLRIPAAACGVFGLKPTRGRISSAPLTEHWHGLATFGAITRTAQDMATTLDTISGNEPHDVWRLDSPTQSFTEAVSAGATGKFYGVNNRNLRVRFALAPILRGIRINTEVGMAMQAFLPRLTALGHEVKQTQFRWPDPSNAFVPLHLSGMHVETKQVQFRRNLTSRTKKTARVGMLVPPFAVRQAQLRAEKLAHAVDELFQGADLIALPTQVDLPEKAHAYANLSWRASLTLARKDIANAALFNVTGHPAMSIHAGFSAAGVPIGIQFVAKRGAEGMLLALAAQLEAAGGIVAEWSDTV
ncbi:amidase [Canibacter zhoujuaniae]|uniref:amidase n=1 Tax=Canibacter zhoujuaniae TaxID=2708343 RepID=UPI00141EE959|nr:amidase family protein [Canibacter zhoujuaniae]